MKEKKLSIDAGAAAGLGIRCVPSVGEVVAICDHEPRPLYWHLIGLPRPVVDGAERDWVVLCRSCKMIAGCDPRLLHLTAREWTEDDALRVKAAAKN